MTDRDTDATVLSVLNTLYLLCMVVGAVGSGYYLRGLQKPTTYASGMAISDPVTGVMRVECFINRGGKSFTVKARSLGINIDDGKARILVEEDVGAPEKYANKVRWIEGTGLCKAYVTNAPY